MTSDITAEVTDVQEVNCNDLRINGQIVAIGDWQNFTLQKWSEAAFRRVGGNIEVRCSRFTEYQPSGQASTDPLDYIPDGLEAEPIDPLTPAVMQVLVETNFLGVKGWKRIAQIIALPVKGWRRND